VKAALQAKLRQLNPVVTDKDVVEIAEIDNQIEDIDYQQSKEAPYNLTDPEKLEFSNVGGESSTAPVAAARPF
jgi:chromatin remodeling complex protein RSC6